MKQISVMVGGEPVEGWAEKIGGALWIHVGGRTFVREPEQKASRRGARGGGGNRNPGDVLAPMPGKINKVSVKAGERVEAQQVVVVMEAMKMEYTLKAQAAGVVAAVQCKPGDQVELGRALIKITPDVAE